MPITTGLVRIKPWDTIEWVTVKSSQIPHRYQIVYEGKNLFEITATTQPEMLEKIRKKWRAVLPERS